MSKVQHIEVLAEQAGQRLDNFLLNRLKGVPKSHIYRILRRGEVRVNKGRAKPTYRLQQGDVVRIPPVQRDERETVRPHDQVLQRLADSVLYEDKHLLVINKPSGIAVHGGSGLSYGVIEGMRALYPQLPYLELVHRLDRETSGCLMLAKKASALRRLHAAFPQIHKTYQALVAGQWSKRRQRVDLPLRKNVLKSGERLVSVSPDGKPAVSEFTVLQHYSRATLLEVRLLTGRTHQIRVHTQHFECPIAGDEKYGHQKFNQYMQQHGLQRLFLHAERLQIPAEDDDHPPLTLTAPLPAELQQVLQHLHS